MVQITLAEDPEPSQPVLTGLLLVPVRTGPAGCSARFFRTPLGERTAVGFTTERRLTDTLGSGQSWIRLSAFALRTLAEPLGVTALTIDPQFSAPATGAKESPRRDWDPRSIDALRVAGTAAVVSCLSLLIG
jgi:hypothetical protein